MFFKNILFFFLIALCCHQAVFAQQDDFCDAMNAIIMDAPNQFRNIRGNPINAGAGLPAFACGIKVPGTINSRFVASMGLFYEGALLQTKNKEEITTAYEKYKKQLNECFAGQGYKISFQENFFPGMKDYKKIVFMPLLKAETKTGDLPPHITMEATYSKDVGFYTIVIYIFEH